MKSTNRFLLRLIAISLASIGFNCLSVVRLNASSLTGIDTLDQHIETYYCDNDNFNYPALVFRSDLGNARLIEFQYEGFNGWPPLKRCQEIAARAQEFHELGVISYLTVEQMPNGANVICISKVDWDHLQALELGFDDLVRLLITLKPDDDPQEILEGIKGITSLSSDGNPLIH